MLVDAFIYSGLSLLNQFFCDSAIIDKTLFYEIERRESVKFRADLEHIINLVEVPILYVSEAGIIILNNFMLSKISL
jgi:hypothetical protein